MIISGGPSTVASAATMTSQEQGEEEIVGTLEEGIGSNVKPDKIGSKLSGPPGERMEDEEQQDAVMSSEPSRTGGYVYDSDSSAESTTRRRDTKLQPTELPFAKQRAPAGVGGVSPFCGLGHLQNLKAEAESWFLVQFPTRLPPLKQSPKPDTVAKLDGMETSEGVVATPAVEVTSFDNILASAQPGRMGKIKVYKSGKTVLVLEREDGRPAVCELLVCVLSLLWDSLCALVYFSCLFLLLAYRSR